MSPPSVPRLTNLLAHWPRERHLEITPKYWAATRAGLDAAELAHEFGPLAVPPTATRASSARWPPPAPGYERIACQ